MAQSRRDFVKTMTMAPLSLSTALNAAGLDSVTKFATDKIDYCKDLLYRASLSMRLTDSEKQDAKAYVAHASTTNPEELLEHLTGEDVGAIDDAVDGLFYKIMNQLAIKNGPQSIIRYLVDMYGVGKDNELLGGALQHCESIPQVAKFFGPDCGKILERIRYDPTYAKKALKNFIKQKPKQEPKPEPKPAIRPETDQDISRWADEGGQNLKLGETKWLTPEQIAKTIID